MTAYVIAAIDAHDPDQHRARGDLPTERRHLFGLAYRPRALLIGRGAS